MLSERDWAILHVVWEHRFVTTGHIQRLHFWQHATRGAGIRACNRVLTRLRERRVLHRLERPIGGVRGGSSAYVWCVGPAGDRLMRAEPNPARTKRTRPFEPTHQFLAHTLAVAELRVTLEDASRQERFELLGVQTEPACWREFTSRQGTAQVLKPDLALKSAIGDFEDRWFIEVDLATESIPALIRKCLSYEAYRASGREQTRLGLFPAVVWLIGDEHRRERLRAAIGGDRRLDGRVFRVVEPATMLHLAGLTDSGPK